MSGQEEHELEVAMFNFLKYNLQVCINCSPASRGDSKHVVSLHLTNPVNKQSVEISSDAIYVP